MKPHELVRRFKLIGCKVNLVKTGSPDYVRGFIVDPDGVSIGRATIHHGELSHIKWYWRGEGDLVNTDFIMIQWRYLQWCDRVLTREMYQSIVEHATELQQDDYNKKVNHRATLKPKKRKSIQGKNIRSFFTFPPVERLLIESVSLGEALREAFTKSATVKRCIWNNGTWKVWV